MIISRFNRTETREKILVPRDRFTPCKPQPSLLEPMTDAAENAAPCGTILLSPARSSFDRFQNARNRGEKIYSKVKSISWGEHHVSPNRNGKMAVDLNQNMSNSGKQNFSLRGFLREKHEANNPLNSTSVQKGRRSAKYNEQS